MNGVFFVDTISINPKQLVLNVNYLVKLTPTDNDEFINCKFEKTSEIRRQNAIYNFCKLSVKKAKANNFADKLTVRRQSVIFTRFRIIFSFIFVTKMNKAKNVRNTKKTQVTT